MGEFGPSIHQSFEKLSSGDVGERDNVSDEYVSCVFCGCEMLSWLPWLFFRIVVFGCLVLKVL